MMMVLRSVGLAALLVTLPAAKRNAEGIAVFAGGCYWGVEAVFEHLRGVRDVVAGFAVPAGTAGDTPLRRTSAAEAVRVVYDPSVISYRQLLEVFFQIAHDPTEVDRQGPDVGPQYRSIVFVSGSTQQRAAQAYLRELASRGQYQQPIATEIATAQSFRPVRDQDFVALNPTDPYVVTHDLPKLEELRRRFPALYRAR